MHTQNKANHTIQSNRFIVQIQSKNTAVHYCADSIIEKPIPFLELLR